MKAVLKPLSLASLIMMVSSNTIAAGEPKIDLYYENPIVMQNTNSKLKWTFSNVDYCTNSSGAPIYSGGSWEARRTNLGVGSSYINCYANGKKIKKNANYYVIHDGPAGATTSFKDAGGGRFYNDKVNANDNFGCLSVRNLTQLRSCMSNPLTKVIFVPEDVIIEVTEATGPIVVEPGKILASNRGHESSPGAAIVYRGGNTQFPAIRMKSNSRLTGFRVVGPTPPNTGSVYNTTRADIGIAVGYIFTYDKNGSGEYNSSSPYLGASNVKIDNNEIYNWPYVGVRIGYKSRNVDVTHNFIHNNRGAGEGYGVLANGTESESTRYSSTYIYKNIFSLNRHDIASSGYAGNSYQALYNIVFDGPIVGTSPLDYLFRFDVHGCSARSDSCRFAGGQGTPTNANKQLAIDMEKDGNDAGLTFYVVNNIFSLKNTTRQRAVQLNGKSKNLSTIGYNWMSHRQLMATNTSGNGSSGAQGAIEIRNYDNAPTPHDVQVVYSQSELRARNVDIKNNDLN